jgi:hypothetical protein
MRLTLRTLLAYLDDILEPSQAREIGEKLTESSFASSLVSRIREVMRRRRLTAPTLTGPGVGIDPNTVAEYLDNTLPPDGVADVEKICLESDVHLAEVAASHQILTLALGEPVDISQQTRERMYALGPAAAKMGVDGMDVFPSRAGSNGLSNRAVGEVLAQAPSAIAPPPTEAVATPAKAAIPDYLRPRSNFKRLFGYSLVALAIIGWGVLMIKDSPFFSRKNQGAGPSGNLIADNGQRAAPIAAGASDQGESVTAPEGAQNSTTADDSSSEGAAPYTRKPAVAPKKVVSVEVPVADESDDEDAPPARRGSVFSKSKTDTGAEPSVADRVEAANKSSTDAAPPAPAVAPPPARYASSEGVTLNYVPRDERWFVLARRAQVHAGDLLAVPEPFQCALEIDGGKSLVTVMGKSVVRILEPTDAGPFNLEIKRGQFVVKPPSSSDELAASLRLGVVIAGDLWRVECRPGAVVGVQINLMEPTKLEQVFDSNAYLGAFYVSMGSAAVTDPTGKTVTINGPGWLELPLRPVAVGEKPPPNRPLLTVPRWMGPQTSTTTAQNYARLFEKRFVLEDAVELSIPEVAADPNPEIARMATECLALIEAYGPLIDILHRSQHEEARKAAISGLRLWLPRSADNKDLLKAELSKRFPPEEAETIYRLLWGFDEEDARNKLTSQQLVEWMGNPELYIRELAFYHVNRLTGKTHDYRPNGTTLQIGSALKRWDAHVRREGGLLPPVKPPPAQ